VAEKILQTLQNTQKYVSGKRYCVKKLNQDSS